MDTHENLINRLRAIDPAAEMDTAAAAQRVVSRVVGAKKQRRLSRGMLAGLVIGGIGLVTAAAVPIAMSLNVNGKPVEFDVVIPITYVDEQQTNHECAIGVYVGSGTDKTGASEQIVEELEDIDWSGLGQRAFDRSVSALAGEESADEKRAIFVANVSMLYDEALPVELLSGDQVIASSIDCTGAGL